jgi:hypothetical protein
VVIIDDQVVETVLENLTRVRPVQTIILKPHVPLQSNRLFQVRTRTTSFQVLDQLLDREY